MISTIVGVYTCTAGAYESEQARKQMAMQRLKKTFIPDQVLNLIFLIVAALGFYGYVSNGVAIGFLGAGYVLGVLSGCFKGLVDSTLEKT